MKHFVDICWLLLRQIKRCEIKDLNCNSIGWFIEVWQEALQPADAVQKKQKITLFKF